MATQWIWHARVRWLENTKHLRVVNFLCSSKGQTIFLDSVETGSTSQTSVNQAALAGEVMQRQGGVANFAAIVSDNTESFLKMRAKVAENNPGMVPLGDQAHIADLMIENMCKNRRAATVIADAVFVGNYVRGRNGLLSHYLKCLEVYNKNIVPPSRTAVQFAKVRSTRFAYVFDLLDRCCRNKSVSQQMVNDCDAFDDVPQLRDRMRRRRRKGLQGWSRGTFLARCDGLARWARALTRIFEVLGLT